MGVVRGVGEDRGEQGALVVGHEGLWALMGDIPVEIHHTAIKLPAPSLQGSCELFVLDAFDNHQVEIEFAQVLNESLAMALPPMWFIDFDGLQHCCMPYRSILESTLEVA